MQSNSKEELCKVCGEDCVKASIVRVNQKGIGGQSNCSVRLHQTKKSISINE